jgi:hypothetical protein
VINKKNREDKLKKTMTEIVYQVTIASPIVDIDGEMVDCHRKVGEFKNHKDAMDCVVNQMLEDIEYDYIRITRTLKLSEDESEDECGEDECECDEDECICY